MGGCSPLAGGVACERTYQVVLDGEPRQLFCRWFVPEPHPDGDWECRVEITWPNGRVRRRVAGGVDSTQALMLGFSLVCSDFLVSETPIYWFEEHDDLSLPNVSVLAGDVAARKARFDSKDKTVPPSTSEC